MPSQCVTRRSHYGHGLTRAGAAGAISGSAVVKIVEEHSGALVSAGTGDEDEVERFESARRDLVAFVSRMKAATRR